MRFKNLKFLLIALAVTMCFGQYCYASDDHTSSGLPLPRFVSISSGEANVRSGPGKQYPVKWVLKHKSMPVEIILEFEHWRKIKDVDGQEGWVYYTLLSGKRTAMILGDDKVPAYEKRPKSLDNLPRLSLYLEPRVIANIRACKRDFCHVEASGYLGWVARKSLWGVYEHENFD